LFDKKARTLRSGPAINIRNRSGLSAKYGVTELASKCTNMKKWKSIRTETKQYHSGMGLKRILLAIRRRLDREDGSNTQQLELFDSYCDYLCNRDDPRYEQTFPQMILIHGCPGVGKSKLRDAICEASEAAGSYCLKTAFNAINATEMGGCTTSSLSHALPEIHMVRFAHISREVVTDLKGEGFGADSCVLLDECSTQRLSSDTVVAVAYEPDSKPTASKTFVDDGYEKLLKLFEGIDEQDLERFEPFQLIPTDT